MPDLPFSESVIDSVEAFEAVKLYLYDVTGVVSSDADVLHFLCMNFLVFVTGGSICLKEIDTSSKADSGLSESAESLQKVI